MTFEEWYRRLTEEVVDPEKVLLAVMGVASGYMLWGTTQFDIDSAARFPRLTATVVFVGSVLLFFQEYLPEPLRQAVLSEGGVLEVDEEFTQSTESAETDGEGVEPEAERVTDGNGERKQISTVGRPIHDSMFTALSVIGYALLGYAIGLLWATPLFVVAYARWFRVRPLFTVALAAIGFGINWAFMIVLNVPMNTGVLLTGVLTWLP